ncbi:PIR Superfamily Protein [Plasmodium ovale wallikeri]|uniref:PIR Superfamily Protein n=1 Tax=Plasmodium ovale wallikeri TaxID=864142 RepID=A0A1A9ACL1_PLAOA|nr:PIR Superfamily Protein [Plasmodium ovale wallikeri]SBT57094.1 PIR Superfamily Protein [Plasmodium ovale wallikeri]
MGHSLNDLAEAEIYKGNDNFVKLFNDLDKVCTEEDYVGYPCQSFEYMNVKEPFKSQLQKIFTILQRNKAHDNIYLNEVASGNHKSCVYYKYWFYHKIISHNTEKINFKELNQIWSKNTMNIYNLFLPEHCKFRAKNLEDVKILKVLYDHIFFFNSVDNNYNFNEKIKKCEFCKHLDNYLKQEFKNSLITCASASSIAFCVEYNGNLKKIIDLNELSSLSCESDTNVLQCPSYSKSQQPHTGEMLSGTGGEESLPVIQADATPQGLPQNPEERNLSVQNIIGGVSVLGISSILFLLYKYTSLGHLVRSRTTWIKDTWRTPQEIDNEILLLDDSETYHINSDNPQYNIAYNTVQDY